MKRFHEEKQYLNLIHKVLNKGNVRFSRNGKTISYFGNQLRFSLRNNTIPILTTKKVAVKTCLYELFWFISGNTSNRWLNERNVHIWDKNAIDYNNNDDLGFIYGHQWRRYNAPDYNSKGIDQLQNIIHLLKNKDTKFSRRLIMNAWNPCQINKMALPPCHILSQFYVDEKNELSCHVYQRSGDIGLGIPFNIMSYATLTHLLAKHTNLNTGDLILSIGDAHIYPNHVSQLIKQTKREPFPFPKIFIKNTYNDIDKYSIKDIQIKNYVCHDKINMDMVS